MNQDHFGVFSKTGRRRRWPLAGVPTSFSLPASWHRVRCAVRRSGWFWPGCGRPLRTVDARRRPVGLRVTRYSLGRPALRAASLWMTVDRLASSAVAGACSGRLSGRCEPSRRHGIMPRPDRSCPVRRRPCAVLSGRELAGVATDMDADIAGAQRHSRSRQVRGYASSPPAVRSRELRKKGASAGGLTRRTPLGGWS
jgi:hypothetical protein